MKKILYITVLFILFVSTAYAKKDIKIYKSIEFKNITYLSKYEIIDLTDYSIKEKNIIIDINSLERVLNEMSMVNSYKLTEKDQSLLVSIVENQPVFPLCVRDGDKNLLAELDKDFHLISAGRIHVSNMPIIIISQEEMKNKVISARLKNFLGLISDLNRTGLSVMKEINEINYTDISTIKISLKGRRTVFNIGPDKESFNKLNYAAGYFDRIKYYPHTFTILNDAGILE
jgi:hypothetical protein